MPPRGPRKAKSVDTSLDFAFFNFLWQFYRDNRGTIAKHYKELSRKFLDFNNPEKNPKAFLRDPQFEALEMYVFLKEFLGNARVEEIFHDWFTREGRFADRKRGGIQSVNASLTLFDDVTQAQYERVFASMKHNQRVYPNYIFALTMGTGKTILMGTCIFYEFLLGNKWEKDERFCHNALVFAPDKTVLHSLKEIESFELARVVPPEYVKFLTSHLRFHYLEEAGTSLDTLDKSRFNIIVSNSQKIILKRIRKDRTQADLLFGSGKPTFQSGSVYDQNQDLYNFDEPEDDADLATNQRFEKLRRLEQLGIFVDEAHHAFGKGLAKDMGVGTSPDDTSLRTTIDKLAESLQKAGTRVVACYNFTGTPYVGKEVLPEVVYAYGLREAIEKGYLKKVQVKGYTNPKSSEFVKLVVDSFLESTKGLRPAERLPKLAFFASDIQEANEELKPTLVKILEERGIPASRIVINVGDEKITSKDELREFYRLDTPESEKQFVILVNKGREGWNCQSLFGVALFRTPKSKVFVLQATMRCLRAIGEAQYTGHVYLSDDNLKILDDELQQNFRISTSELTESGSQNKPIEVRINPPPVKVKLMRVRRTWTMQEKALRPGAKIGVDPRDTAWEEMVAGYRLIETTRSGLTVAHAVRNKETKVDLTEHRERREFSRLTLVAEIARYLNRSPLQIEDLLAHTFEGTDVLLDAVNQFNELLYDKIIPSLFRQMYDLTESKEEHEIEVELVRPPLKGHYDVTAHEDMVVRMDNIDELLREKSFHLDTYCFDSLPEMQAFNGLLNQKSVRKMWFTGMLTHGQSDFYVQYVDPESHTVRTYYPDFLIQRDDDKYVILEVKAANQIDAAVTQAKKTYASQMADASGMEYRIVADTRIKRGNFAHLLDEDDTLAPEQADLPGLVLPFKILERSKRRPWENCLPLVRDLAIAAGRWGEERATLEADPEWVEDWIEVPESVRKLEKGMFVAQIHGTSMDKIADDNSWCLFQPWTSKPERGMDGLFWRPGKLDPTSGASYTFKRFESERVPGDEHVRRIRLVPQSSDPSHDPIELGEEDDGIRLLARFVAVVG